MPVLLPLIVIGFGIALLLFGTRLWLLGAGVGALLGIGLLRLFPGEQGGWLALIVVVGLAAIVGFFAVFAKGIANLVIMALGFLAGGAIVFSILDLFTSSMGLLDWILSLVGGVIGAVLARRFSRWAYVFLAGIIGALLVVRGVQIWFPSFEGAIATLIGIVLAGASIAYQGGWIGGRKPPAEAK